MMLICSDDHVVKRGEMMEVRWGGAKAVQAYWKHFEYAPCST